MRHRHKAPNWSSDGQEKSVQKCVRKEGKVTNDHFTEALNFKVFPIPHTGGRCVVTSFFMLCPKERGHSTWSCKCLGYGVKSFPVPFYPSVLSTLLFSLPQFEKFPTKVDPFYRHSVSDPTLFTVSVPSANPWPVLVVVAVLSGAVAPSCVPRLRSSATLNTNCKPCSYSAEMISLAAHHTRLANLRHHFRLL